MVNSLILAGSALSGYRVSEGRQRVVSEILSTVQEENPEKWVEMWLDDAFWAPERKRIAARRKLRELLVESFRYFAAGARPEKQNFFAASRLSEISVPTLVIVGERDSPDNRSIADMLASGIPAVEKVVIPGAAHMVNIEEPKEFNLLVLRFLKRWEMKGSW